MNNICAVYMLTNAGNKVIYTGVTANLEARLHQHRVARGTFVSKYKVYKLVYYEVHTSIQDAIVREKQIKAGSRKKKTDMINSLNSAWVDLADTVFGTDN